MTVLHQAVANRLGLATLFGPMVATQVFAGDAPDAATVEHLRATLFEPQHVREVASGGLRCRVPGRARGVLVGGTLALLVNTVGTADERRAGGGLLVLEDVAEPPYRIDSMLTRLLRTGWFDDVAGVVLGSWADCGAAAVGTVVERPMPLGFPVATGLAVGHGAAADPAAGRRGRARHRCRHAHRPAARPAMTAGRPAVRAYDDEDHDAVYDVCLRTGHVGSDASSLVADPRLLGDVWAGPYLAAEPGLASVVTDADGVCGYVLGALDTRGFEAWCERSWWPGVRRRVPEPPVPPQSFEERLARLVHHPPRAPDDVLTAGLPSHLHLDLLPRAQGHGLGRVLLTTFLTAVAAAGSSGVHVGVSPRNGRARRFWARSGFDLLREDAEVDWIGPPHGLTALAGQEPSALLLGRRAVDRPGRLRRGCSAVLTRPTWRTPAGSCRAAARPPGRTPRRAGRRRCAGPAAARTRASASSLRPMRARSSASQNVQGRNAPSPAGQPVDAVRLGSVAPHEPVGRQLALRRPRTVPTTRGSLAGRKPTMGHHAAGWRPARVEP